MPPAGRDAFRLYYDARAETLYQQMLQPSIAGTPREKLLGEQIYREYLLSSVGPAAADRLGDLLFAQGEFRQAADIWRSLLEQASAAEVDPLRLRIKQAFALHRSGANEAFEALRAALISRNGDDEIVLGGRSTKVAELLAKLDSADSPRSTDHAVDNQAEPLWTQLEKLEIAWQSRFLTSQGQEAIDEMTRQNWSANGSGINRMVPAIAYDGDRLYANWLGVVFAIDRNSGKVVWSSEPVGKMTENFQHIVNRGRASPGSYQIAVHGESLLVISYPVENARWNEPYRLTVLDKATGKATWQAKEMEKFKELGFTSKPLVLEDQAVYVTHPLESQTLHLRGLSPANTADQWQMQLGEFEPMQSRHGNNSPPVTAILSHGSLVYVLTNNGALLAIDLENRRTRWAIKFRKPNTVREENRWHNNALNARNHRAGSIVHDDGLLYIKEAGGERLIAVRADTGKVLWQHRCEEDALIVEQDGELLYLLGKDLMARHKRDGSAAWSRKLPNRHHAFNADQHEQYLGMFIEGGISLLDTDDGDQLKHWSHPYLDDQSGNLYAFDDLLVLVSPTAITAFRMETDAKENP
jgi:outer membrane protein assembly factor BamB